MFKDLEQQRQWRKKNFEHYQHYSKKWRKGHSGYFELPRKKDHLKNVDIIHELKINGCAICGYNKCDRALNFHHVNTNEREFSITSNQVGNKNFVDELHKCILLCCNCHTEIHAL